MKREDAVKPYDSKKSYWAPDGKGGFMEGLVESNDGKKAVMMFGHIVSTIFLDPPHIELWVVSVSISDVCPTEVCLAEVAV